MLEPLPPLAAEWAPHEEAFHDVARILALAPGFVLVPVAVPGPDLARALGQWLSEAGYTLETWELSGDAEWERLAWFLLHCSPPADGVVMVIGPRAPPQRASAALALVNQARDAIVKSLRRPLLWCGPRSFLNVTWEEAPDFWSIRSVDHSMDAAPAAPVLESLPARAPAPSPPAAQAVPSDAATKPGAPPSVESAAAGSLGSLAILRTALSQGDPMSAAILAAREAESALADARPEDALRLLESPLLTAGAVPASLRQRLAVLRVRALRASGRRDEAVRALDSLYAKGRLAPGGLDPAVELEALLEEGSLAAETGDLDRAEALFTQAMARAREVGSPEGEAQARLGLGEAALSRGQPGRASKVILAEGEEGAAWLRKRIEGTDSPRPGAGTEALVQRARSVLALAARQTHDSEAASRIAGTSLLDEDELHRVHAAAVSAGLASSRDALFAGVNRSFAASLPLTPSPGAQVLIDLHQMNKVDRLLDGQQPLAIWLRNAVTLAGALPEAAVFAEALKRLRRTGPRTPTPAASPASPAPGPGAAVPKGPEPEVPLCLLLHAERDREAAHALRTHMTPLLRAGRLRWWSPDQMVPGEAVAHTLEQRLREADIVLVLVSANFMADDELMKSAEAARAMGKRVIPIFWKPALWEESNLAHFAGLPLDGRPIATRRDQDQAWTEVVNGIRSLLKRGVGPDRRS